MYDAARAALLASEAPVKSEVIKTHGGLITAFSLHLIMPGRILAQHGKALAQVSQIRLLADYSDMELTREKAASALEQTDRFIEAVADYVKT